MRNHSITHTAETVLHGCLTPSDIARLPPSILTCEERCRAEKFRFPADRSRFLTGRVALKGLVSRHLGTPITHVRIVPDERGCPRLPRTGLECSISHSADAVAVAVSTLPIGVDVQYRPHSGSDGWMRVLNNAELASNGLDEMEHFLHRWTQVEAVTKMTGLGLTAAPEERSLMGEEFPRSWYRLTDGTTAVCTTVELTPLRAVSVCVPSEAGWRSAPNRVGNPILPPVFNRWTCL